MDLHREMKYNVWIKCNHGTVLMSTWNTLEKAIKECESLQEADSEFTYTIGEIENGKDNDLRCSTDSQVQAECKDSR